MVKGVGGDAIVHVDEGLRRAMTCLEDAADAHQAAVSRLMPPLLIRLSLSWSVRSMFFMLLVFRCRPFCNSFPSREER